MAYTLGHKCAKNCCKRTILVQLIVKNVITCFLDTVFPYKRYGNISMEIPPPNDDVECRWGRQKSRFSANVCLHRVLSTVPHAHSCAGPLQVGDTSRW